MVAFTQNYLQALDFGADGGNIQSVVFDLDIDGIVKPISFTYDSSGKTITQTGSSTSTLLNGSILTLDGSNGFLITT
ncbi:hypothetical protein [Endozoicomonas atrinae]|uniref:hypothetical protein n=1 Tax=Endozoicomonas atrinae TaxID=1333660 RepID=UPI003AFF8354